MNGIKYITAKKVNDTIQISDQTLRRLADSGQINSVKTITGKRLYDIDSIVSVNNKRVKGTDQIKKKVCYCRVSSKKQKDDLQRQIDYMRTKYPDHQIYSDIGSGINWNRKDFSKLLSESYNGIITEIVIAHRDRLSRFSFDLLEKIFKLSGTKLVVLDKDKYQSAENELSEDLLSIIHIFNCRQMGKRRYSKSKGRINTDKEDTNLSNKETTETT